MNNGFKLKFFITLAICLIEMGFFYLVDERDFPIEYWFIFNIIWGIVYGFLSEDKEKRVNLQNSLSQSALLRIVIILFIVLFVCSFDVEYFNILYFFGDSCFRFLIISIFIGGPFFVGYFSVLSARFIKKTFCFLFLK